MDTNREGGLAWGQGGIILFLTTTVKLLCIKSAPTKISNLKDNEDCDKTRITKFRLSSALTIQPQQSNTILGQGNSQKLNKT